jgi:outer membrane protein OmpA-like peptidoglycan-associated protein
MRPILLASMLLATVSGAALAQDSALTSEGVVEFMQQEIIDLGKTRGICVGTAEECAPRPPKGLDMLVTFELNSADLTPDARENLSVFAEALNDDRLATARFVVEGHTDARGTDSLNDALSEARAASVKAYLTELGVSDERLTAIGLGKTQPRTADAFAPENRRVELRIDVQ